MEVLMKEVTCCKHEKYDGKKEFGHEASRINADCDCSIVPYCDIT